MGALARLYGGIEERLTAAEDLRAERRRRPRDVAVRRGQPADAAQLGASPAGVHPHVVGRAGRGDRRLGARLVVSATLVSSGAISLGTAFLLFQYVLLMSRPLEDLVHQLETVQKANGAMVRVDRPARPSSRRSSTPARRRRRPARSPSAAAACRSRTLRHDGLDETGPTQVVSTSGADDPPRPRPGHRARPLGRRRRAHRQRQDDVLPPAAAPRRGRPRARCRWAACRSPTSPWPSCAAASRSCPRRSSCSRARSATTSRCSTPTPTDAAVIDALQRRRPRRRSPTPASTARSAPAGPGCRPARPSCWRWPGCGCASPTSSCSTRPRPASTRSPSSAWRRPSPS